MRKALPCAVGVVLSLAMLGFVLRHGLEISKPGVEVDFPGWQYTAMRWGLVGGALVLGLVAAVWAWRRSRRLEGEGLLLVVPAILSGLLLSGATSAAASPAEDWAMHRTATWQDAERQQRAYEAENKLRPVPVPMHNYPAAAAALVPRVPTLDELGPGWFDNQRPSVVGPTSGQPGAGVRFVKATATKDGWNFDRTLWVRVTDYGKPEAAAAAAAPQANTQPAVTYTSLRVAGVDFRVRATAGSVLAFARRGTLVWSVWLNAGYGGEVLPVAERDAYLAIVAKRIR